MKSLRSIGLALVLAGCSTSKPALPSVSTVAVTALPEETGRLPERLTEANVIIMDVISASEGRAVLGRFSSASNRIEPLVYLNQPQGVGDCISVVQAHALKAPAVTPVMLNFLASSPSNIRDEAQKAAFTAFSNAFKSGMRGSSFRIAWLESTDSLLWTSHRTVH